MKARTLFGAACALVALAADARYVPPNFSDMTLLPQQQDGEAYVALKANGDYRVTGAYVFNESSSQSADAVRGALRITNKATVTLWFDDQASLEANGAKATSQDYGAGAGIYVESGATLILRMGVEKGTARVKATGGAGKAASGGGDGKKGGGTKGGNGGDGGKGGSAGGAGIGGYGGGGRGGGSGTKGVECGTKTSNGNKGTAGTGGSACGNVWIFEDIEITATAGAGGAKGDGGSAGSRGTSHVMGGGGGGGGGGAGGQSQDIGGGAGGGGGGGGGAGANNNGGGGGGGGAPSGKGGSGGQGGYEPDGVTGTTPTGSSGGGGGGGGTSSADAGTGGTGGNAGTGGNGGMLAYVATAVENINGGKLTRYDSAGCGGAPTLGKCVLFEHLGSSTGGDASTLQYNGTFVASPIRPPELNDSVFLGYFTKKEGEADAVQIVGSDGTVLRTVAADCTALYAHWDTPWDRLKDEIVAASSNKTDNVVTLTRDYCQVFTGLDDLGGTIETAGDVTLDLNGHTLSLAGGDLRFLNVKGGKFTLKGQGLITIDTVNGSSPNLEGSAVLVSNGGTFVMESGTISNLVSAAGKGAGAVCVESGGVFEMKGSGAVVSTCQSAKGAGVTVKKGGTFTLTNGLIEKCNAEGNGGGIWSEGTLNLAGGHVQSCRHETGCHGAAVYSCGKLTMTGTYLMDSDAITTTDILYCSGTKDGGQATVSGGAVRGAVALDPNAGSLLIYGGVFTVSDNPQISAWITDGQAATVVGARYVVGVAETVASANGYLTAGLYTFNPTGTLYADELQLINPSHGATAALTDDNYYRLNISAEYPLGVTTFDEVKYNLQAGNSVYLANPIKLNGNKTVILNDSTVTGILDFRGQNIQLQSGYNLPFDITAGTLILTNANEGAGIVGDASNPVREGDGGAFVVRSGAALKIRGGLYQNVRSSSRGGLVFVAEGGSLDFSGGEVKECRATNGGAFAGEGSIAMSGGMLKNCVASGNGGGIASSGELTLNGGTISGCEAVNGGGVWTEGTAIIRLVEITDCSASAAGGGLCTYGETEILGANINGNTAANGGGVAMMGGTANVRIGTTDVSTKIDANTARQYGGAYYAGAGSLTVWGGQMKGNALKAGEGLEGAVLFVVDGAGAAIYGGAIRKNSMNKDEAQQFGSSTETTWAGIWGGAFDFAPPSDRIAAGYVSSDVVDPYYVVGVSGTISANDNRLTAGVFTFSPTLDPVYGDDADVGLGLVDQDRCNVETLGGTPPLYRLIWSSANSLFIEGMLTKGGSPFSGTMRLRASVSGRTDDDRGATTNTTKVLVDDRGYYSAVLVGDLADYIDTHDDAWLHLEFTRIEGGAIETLTGVKPMRVGYVPYVQHVGETHTVERNALSVSTLTLTNLMAVSTLTATGTVNVTGALIVTNGVEGTGEWISTVTISQLKLNGGETSFLSPVSSATRTDVACPKGEKVTEEIAVEYDSLLIVMLSTVEDEGSFAVKVVAKGEYSGTETLFDRADCATGGAPGNGRPADTSITLCLPVRAADTVTIDATCQTGSMGSLNYRLVPFGLVKEIR